jgi:Peptidase A4 family
MNVFTQAGWKVGLSLVGMLSVATIAAVGPDALRTQVPVGKPGHRHDPIIIRERHGKNVTSTNWGGYAVTGANGSVTHVKGSWRVPPVLCASTPTAYSSFWVGIDGYSSNTVEQIGTDSDCVAGKATYYVWYEFYPHPSYTVNTIAISSGDVITAEITYSAKVGQFTLVLTDVTTAQSFSIGTKMNNAKLSSAEWIAEAPSSGGILPLADFGIADFGGDLVSGLGTTDTCYATVGGLAQSVGAFFNQVLPNNTFQINMTDKNGLTKVSVLPSPSSSVNFKSFTAAWLSPGP